jgi:hypothetical protein
MEATHFIEVWKYSNDPETEMENSPSPIRELDEDLEFSKKHADIQTVAVWRIKETDVPIEKRLGDRFLGGAGLVSPNYLDRAVKL